ncbi:MAG: hypothetical protein J7639_26925 [Paenibacillaceae bacterium]|nr:hypothetical protein [Paenibacillaceae bacterium]
MAQIELRMIIVYNPAYLLLFVVEPDLIIHIDAYLEPSGGYEIFNRIAPTVVVEANQDVYDSERAQRKSPYDLPGSQYGGGGGNLRKAGCGKTSTQSKTNVTTKSITISFCSNNPFFAMKQVDLLADVLTKNR